MNLTTYNEARARITKISDENTRIAAASALEARWYEDVADIALKLGRGSPLHREHYSAFGGYLVKTIVLAHCNIVHDLFPKGDPREITDLLDFLDSRKEK